MSKKALILVLSFDSGYYRDLAYASKQTWDSIDVPGIEVVYYFGDEGMKSKLEYDPKNRNLFTGTGEGLTAIGYKNIAAFEWALENRDFDYIIRVNASTYVNKKLVHEYIQHIPEKGLYLGVGAPFTYKGDDIIYGWGPMFMISKDVAQNIVDNKNFWPIGQMDDTGTAILLHELGIFLNNKGPLAAIDIAPHSKPERYFLTTYNCDGAGGQFSNITDIAKLNLPFIRLKQDYDRTLDVRLMKDIFNVIDK